MSPSNSEGYVVILRQVEIIAAIPRMRFDFISPI